MVNSKSDIYEIKEILLDSPLRQRLMEEITIPFKDIILDKLGEIIEDIKALENNRERPIKIVIVGEV
ncbi:MAG: hypothetical protein ACRC3Y_05745, partial [Romboutsia sp.]|uniref:hypothetical protein n=1 Tax=Romboutsia sp. TaxID=1965302 RepID=UPI003F378722